MKTYKNGQKRTKLEKNVRQERKTYINVKQCKESTTREKNIHKRIKTDRNVRKYTKICEGEKCKKKKKLKKKTCSNFLLRFSNLFNKPVNYSNFLVTF